MADKPRVEFTRHQIEYLDQMFPEFVADANTTKAEFLVQAGKRSVVRFLKSRTQKENQ